MMRALQFLAACSVAASATILGCGATEPVVVESGCTMLVPAHNDLSRDIEFEAWVHQWPGYPMFTTTTDHGVWEAEDGTVIGWAVNEWSAIWDRPGCEIES